MFSITRRLTLGYLVSFGTIMVVIALVVYFASAGNERSEFDNELRDYASFLLSEVDTTTSNVSAMYDMLEDVTAAANIRFHSMRFLLAASDTVVYEGDSLMEPIIDSLQFHIDDLKGEQFTTIAGGDNDYRIYALRIRQGSFSLVVVAPLARLHQALARLRNLLLAIVPLSVLIASIGGWFTARRALAPVSRMRASAAAISVSSLHQRVPVGDSNDELAQLATTFNDMIARLEETFAAQRRFVADASHDLRTPLMVIQAKLDRLLAQENFPPHVREDLRHCAGEVEHLARLANDLLLLAKAESHQLRLERERHRLDELLMECVGKMKSLAANKGVSMWLDIDEPVEILGDVVTLRRVLMNILDNAIIHSPESGTVITRLAVDGVDAVITIADNGPGIAQEDLVRVFDRFYRSDAHRTTRGAGLGLAIARTIVEAHGGSIRVASGEGEGTTVTITLRRAADDQPHEEPAVAA